MCHILKKKTLSQGGGFPPQEGFEKHVMCNKHRGDWWGKYVSCNGIAERIWKEMGLRNWRKWKWIGFCAMGIWDNWWLFGSCCEAMECASSENPHGDWPFGTFTERGHLGVGHPLGPLGVARRPLELRGWAKPPQLGSLALIFFE